MQIVLSILQILGILFLIALGIIILLLCLILFCPIRYVIDIRWIEKECAKFQVSWLFHLIRANVFYQENVLSVNAHLFIKKIVFTYDLSENKEKDESKKKEQKEQKESSNESIISKIKGIIERTKEAYPKIKKMLKDEKNKAAVVHLKKELIRFLKIFVPKKSKVNGTFSTGSPDTTGQAFGILACFPVMYQKNWKIIPDFTSDDMYFKGTVWGKGRIFGFKIFGVILRIIFDKNCRRLYTMISKFIKWLKRNEKVEDKINE